MSSAGLIGAPARRHRSLHHLRRPFGSSRLHRPHLGTFSHLSATCRLRGEKSRIGGRSSATTPKEALQGFEWPAPTSRGGKAAATRELPAQERRLRDLRMFWSRSGGLTSSWLGN